MTVVNMLSFGDSGAAIADEQTTFFFHHHPSRKFNIANKLRIINNYIFGGSGQVNILDGFYSRLEKVLPVESNFEMLNRYLTTSAVGLINEMKENYCHKEWGMPLKDVLTQKFEERIRGSIETQLGNLNEVLSNNVLLIGGIESGEFYIYHFPFTWSTSLLNRAPYASIGSGSDESGRILSQYIEKKSRKEREHLNKVEGLIKMMEATNQSSLVNAGVGGVPQIIYIDAQGPREIEEETCILVSEIVKGHTFGQLKRTFVETSIEGLVFGNATVKTIEEEMKSQAKKWEHLNRLLRGYKP